MGQTGYHMHWALDMMGRATFFWILMGMIFSFAAMASAILWPIPAPA